MRRPASTSRSGGRSRPIRSTAVRRIGSGTAPTTPQRLLEYWRDYASNLDDDNVLGSTLFTPLDIERLNINMRQGAVRMGAYVPNQLGINRPHPLMPGSRTPVEGLYLCGSSSGNGGGVNGAPGYIAANAIADDLRLKRTWTPVPPPEWKH